MIFDCFTFFNENDLLELRLNYLNDVVDKFIIVEANKTIVCGHWHTSYYHSKYEKKGSEWGEDADFTPFYSEDGAIIAIDACTATSQSINCLVYDNEEL